MSCGIGHRCGSDPALLWLWCRLAAVAPIQPLAWESPYTAGAALKSKRKKKKQKKPKTKPKKPQTKQLCGQRRAILTFFSVEQLE